jgi:hypothetical protein
MREPTLREVGLPVLCCLGAGALLVWAALTGSPQLLVPPAIALLAASVFLAGALALLARAARRPALAAWIATAILTGFMIIGAWIALAGSGEHCSFVVDGRTAGSSAGCRTAFGIGALINAALAAWSVQLAWRATRRSTG